MKIDKLHIDGFGVFNDKQITGFKSGINVLYGKNEAGKSTLLDFIRFTLFDYPRGKSDRRPPLQGGNHGGKIWLESDAKDNLAVFRTGDKKGFELTFKNNTSSDEQLYNRLIGNATLELYKNIFAITIDELRGIDELNDSGMKHKIFSMGLGIGDVDLGSFESTLNDHALSYFRPQGKTQVMLNFVNEIEEKEKEINRLKANLNKYNELTEEKKKIERNLEKLYEDRRAIHQKVTKLDNYNKAYPHFVNYKEAQNKLAGFEDLKDVPRHYLDTYKNERSSKNTLEEALVKIKHELEKEQAQYDKIKLDENLIPHHDLLDYFKRNVAGYEEALTKLEETKGHLESNLAQQNNLWNQIGADIDKEKILKLTNTHLLQAKADQHHEKDEALLETIKRKEELLESVDNSVNKTNQRIASLEENQQNILGKEGSLNKLEEKKNKLEVVLNKSYQSGSVNIGGNPIFKYITYLISILLIVAAIFLFNTQLILAILFAITGLGAIVTSLILKQNNKTSDLNDVGNPLELNKQLNDVKSQIDSYNSIEKEIQTLKIDKNTEEERKINEEKSLERHRGELNTITVDWKKLLNENALPPTLSAKNMRNFLKDLNSLHELINKQSVYKREIDRYKQIVKGVSTAYSKCYPKEEKEPDSLSINKIITVLEENQSKATAKETLKNSIDSKKDLINQEQKKLKLVENKIEALYKAVGVNDEQAFFEYFDKQSALKDTEQICEQEKTVLKTICGIDNFEAVLNELDKLTLEELAYNLKAANENKIALDEEYKENERKLGSITTDIKHLLQPDEMYQLLNQKESLETRLNEAYKEWLATKIALKVLNDTKLAYEKEKQPEVITYSKEFFKAFTDNAYEDVRISLSKQEVALIDHAGKQKEVDQLSRGTREQLLLALRLGLIKEYENNSESLPIVFDDIMVNFDKVRAKNISNVLKNFSKNRQIIFFTCHKNTADLLQSVGGNVINW